MAIFNEPLPQPKLPLTEPGSSSTGGGTNTAVEINVFSVSSGLFDVTQAQYAITFAPGVLNRFYRYVGPLVNLTDKFTGSFQLSNTAAVLTLSFGATSQTLDEMASSINSGYGAYCHAYVVKLGTEGYLVLESPSTSHADVNATDDQVLSISNVALTNENDPYMDVQFIPFKTNALGLQTQQPYQWAFAIRDQVTGHLSNLSPITTIDLLNYPSEINLTMKATLQPNQVIEVYRTPQGGSTLLFLGYATGSDGTYTFRDTFGDGFLNPQLVGPIAETNDPPPQGLFGLVSHQGRLWGIVDNRVYFSRGPEVQNGSGNEAWSPSDYFAFPGKPIRLLSTASGLAVFLRDDVHLIRGVDSASFFPQHWMSGFGILSPQAVDYDGQTIYVYTSKQQLHAISREAQHEIGFPIGDLLVRDFPANRTSLSLHRGSSQDYALYVSNGSDTIMRYDPRPKAWSPKSVPLTGAGAGRVKSLETATGVNTLLMADATGTKLWKRALSIWTDNGTPFSAFAIIGTLQVAEPGTVATLSHVAMQLKPHGTLPTVSLLFNEIDSSIVPFTELFNPVPDPPDLYTSANPAPKTLWSYRWYTKATNTPLALWFNTVQLKLEFPAEDAANEVLGIYFKATAQ